MTEDSVLDTLRHVPDRIILAVMGRDLDLNRGNVCLCGWFVRERLAEMRNVAASSLCAMDANDVTAGLWEPVYGWCSRMFGGTEDDWNEIYYGAAGMLPSGFDDDPSLVPIIESAFVRRVDEAYEHSLKRPPRRRSAKRSRKIA